MDEVDNENISTEIGDKDNDGYEGNEEDNYLAVGMCLGMCFGALVGHLLFKNMGVGMGIGMCLGLTIGLSIKQKE